MRRCSWWATTSSSTPLANPGAGGHWSGLGGDFTGARAAVLGPDGRVSVFVRTTGGQVRTAHVQAAQSGWSAWTGLAGDLAGDPVAVAQADGTCALFGLGRDGDMFTTKQTAPDGAWEDWVELVDSLKP